MVLEIITIPSFESWDHVESKHIIRNEFWVSLKYQKQKKKKITTINRTNG